MTKFILGLLVGLMAGILFSPYLSGTDLNALINQARAAMGRHIPVNN